MEVAIVYAHATHLPIPNIREQWKGVKSVTVY